MSASPETRIPPDSAQHPPSSWALWRLFVGDFSRTVRLVWSECLRINVLGRSAQFAYYAIFSTAPLLMLILATATLLPIGGLMESFLAAVDEGMPQQTARLIRLQVESISFSTGWGLAAASALLVGWSGSGVFLTLGEGLDAAHGIERRRTFLRERLVSVVMSYLTYALLVVTMILLVFGSRFALALSTGWNSGDERFSSAIFHLTRWSIAGLFFLLAASFLYWIVPNRRLRWNLFSPGCVLASCGWITLTVSVDVYVDRFSRMNETYGTLGGIVVLLMWFHLTGLALLAGGVVDGTLVRMSREIQTDLS